MKRNQFEWWEEATLALAMWLAVVLSSFRPTSEHPLRGARRGPPRRS